MTYAVAYVNFYDNDLQLKTVDVPSTDWKVALEAAFPGHAEHISDDLEEAKNDAFNQDWLFAVEAV